jgi:hypothetical protein
VQSSGHQLTRGLSVKIDPSSQLGSNRLTLEVKVPPIKTLAKLKEKESRLGVSSARPDITAWISSSVGSEMLDDESNDPSFVWRRDIAMGEWTEALEYASRQLLTSRTSVRIPFIRDDLLALVKNEGT